MKVLAVIWLFLSSWSEVAAWSCLPKLRRKLRYSFKRNSLPGPLSAQQQDADGGSRFGRQDYWDDFYRDTKEFSWYTGWEDLEPFLRELILPKHHILLPGVGNDAMLLDMYEAGFHKLTAFDYAPESILRCQEMLGPSRIASVQLEDTDQPKPIIDPDQSTPSGVTLFVGDARNLHQLQDISFDIVLEKGTLDAIVQSGGGLEATQKALGRKNMELAVSEFARVLQPCGLFLSISAICTEALQSYVELLNEQRWGIVRDGSLYMTEDGYASNNFDGTLLAWRKKR